MYFILAKADFSQKNIGTLDSWSVSHNSPNGITWGAAPTSVDKNAALNFTATLDAANYEVTSSTVTMSGVDITLTALSKSGNIYTINISSVTGPVVVRFTTKNLSTGDTDDGGNTGGGGTGGNTGGTLTFTFDSATENGIDLSSIGTVSGGALTTTSSTNTSTKNGIALASPITLTKNESFTIEFITSYASAANGNGTVLGAGVTSGGFVYIGHDTNLIRFRDINKAIEVNGTLVNGKTKTHLAVVYNADTRTFQMYQDGAVIPTSIGSGSVSAFADTTITTFCGGYSTNYPYLGTMSYFRYSKAALSPSDFHIE